MVPHTHILALVDRFGFPEQSYRNCSFPPGNGWSESQMASLVPENDSEAYSQAQVAKMAIIQAGTDIGRCPEGESGDEARSG